MGSTLLISSHRSSSRPEQVVDPLTQQNVNWCQSNFTDAPTCTTTAVYVRNSFLRVSDKRQYVPVNWVDSRFERAGLLQVGAPDRRPVDRCGATRLYFETDFLNYSINRHNIWYDWHDEAGERGFVCGPACSSHHLLYDAGASRTPRRNEL